MRARVAILLALLAAAPAGCGPTPPQAPPAAAARLDTSLSQISSACGLMYQESAFAPPPAARRAALESAATAQARKLAAVYARDPRWIYQGETVRTIVGESHSALGSCGLTRARAALAAQTGR
jgi:hypothetical protein